MNAGCHKGLSHRWAVRGRRQTGEYSPLSAAVTGALGVGARCPRADHAVSIRCWVDRPYLSNRYGAVREPSANVSRSPTRRSGRPSPASAIVSATADPRPPVMVWFSAVTTTRALAAASWTVAVSRGLTVGTLMTETETAWPASARAAASAAA